MSRFFSNASSILSTASSVLSVASLFSQTAPVLVPVSPVLATTSSVLGRISAATALVQKAIESENEKKIDSCLDVLNFAIQQAHDFIDNCPTALSSEKREIFNQVMDACRFISRGISMSCDYYKIKFLKTEDEIEFFDSFDKNSFSDSMLEEELEDFIILKTEKELEEEWLLKQKPISFNLEIINEYDQEKQNVFLDMKGSLDRLKKSVSELNSLFN